MEVIAVIPARGGSKSIPLKNIKNVGGKPLIEYTIETALKSNKISKVIVSTDSIEISKLVEKYKKVLIIKRPKYLSTDTATTESCLIHVLETISKNYNLFPEIVLTLEPTSPFRSLKTINSAVDALRDGKSDSVLGVKETTECIGKIINNRFEHIFKNQPRRRQDRDPLYVESSTIYGTLSKTLIKNGSVLGKNPFPIIVDKYESIDINEKFDLIVAESYIKLLNYT